MTPLLQNVGLPLFVEVRAGALGSAARVLASHHLRFARALVLTGAGATRGPGRRLARSLERGGAAVRCEAVRAGSIDEVERIKREMIEAFYPDVLVAVGGGSVIDAVKLAASERRLAWISAPTAASNDGFCSPVAVLTVDGARRSLGAAMPAGVIADPDVLARAPRRLRLAGVGDLLSNLSACADWDAAADRGKARPDGLARMLAGAGPRQLLGTPNPDIDDPAFARRVVEGLALAGVAMGVCGSSRPCSGSEHLVSHALDAAGAAPEAAHGEQVGVATLFCLTLQDHPDAAAAIDLAERLCMARRPGDLGVSRAAFLDAVKRGPGMRPGRWTVLNGRGARTTGAAAAWDACFGAEP